MIRRGIATGTAVAAVVAMSVACSASTTDVFSLQVGDCFDDPPTAETQVAEVGTVDCDGAHDNEVYAIHELEETDFPGEEQLVRDAQHHCLESFEDYVGTPYADSELFATWLYPTEVSWEAGDREVVCVLFLEDGELVGMQRGAGR